ncbi:MAG: ferritin [candidate division Zixibacteria bacterium CG_4_9_14_3_um_filter_46_8]|nr:MAG: ferritin [candidate division Zixibacteria bacterium CG_4_9_14_3_um_filter_46_8]
MNRKIEEAFNDQLNAELHSAYLYLSMAGHFDSANLKGFGNWMKVQIQEEMLHVMKFYDFIINRGGNVSLKPIGAVETKWDTPLSAFEATYKHECYISGRINNLMKLAREENENAAIIFLEWFVTEQVEEEATADEKVRELRMIGDSGPGLFILDRELAQRVFTPPAAGAGA